MKEVITTTYLGLNLSSIASQLKQGEITYALNANIKTYNGYKISYSNDVANEECYTFPPSTVVVGKLDIVEDNQTLYFLKNTVTGESEIGRVYNPVKSCISTSLVEKCECVYNVEATVIKASGCCNYETIVKSKCLNFSTTKPIRAVYKKDNCYFHVYFTDDYNPPRYIDLYNPNGKDECGVPYTEFDCSRINIFPDFCKPTINTTQIKHGGSLKEGAYQVTIGYTDKYGNLLTSYFEPTHPTFIYEKRYTNETDFETSQSIEYNIHHKTNIFQYFNVVVFETINNVVTPKLLGTYPISTTKVTVTNNNKSSKDLSLTEVIKTNPKYLKAGIIGKSSEYLFLADLEGQLNYNFQSVAKQITPYWKTIQVPANKLDDYNNGVNAGKYRTFQRDEVYPLGIKFHLTDGTTSCTHPLIGREARAFDKQLISSATNKDAFSVHKPCDDDVEFVERYKVYNTGSNWGKVKTWKPEYLGDDCNIHEYEYGEFGYWESTETYPCNDAWGDLGGKPIRHFKFPDSKITHIHDSYNGQDFDHKSFIYPIGIHIDEAQINYILKNTKILNPLTGEEILASDLVCGFELVYGNRVNHKSIVAKGLLYDVCKFEDKDNPQNTYFYPNYPFNDPSEHTAGVDPYLYNSHKFYSNPEFNKKYEVKPFTFAKENGFNRFTFHSPDTHFQTPKLGTELKLETIEYGIAKGHFTPIYNHPRYRILTEFDLAAANLLAILSAYKTESRSASKVSTIDTGVEQDFTVTFDNALYLANYEILKESFTKAIPHINYAYQFTSIGRYNNYKVVDNLGFKRRPLDIALYASPNNQSVDDIYVLHNYQRESSVYLKANSPFENNALAGYQGLDDNSKYTLSGAPMSDPCDNPLVIQDSSIRSYYASIKKYIPDQYGRIEDIEWKPTSTKVDLVYNNGVYTFGNYEFAIFGGDTFITPFSLKRKQIFFSQNMVDRPDEIPFDYDLVPNLGYPKYFNSISGKDNLFNTIADPSVWGSAAAALGAYITAKFIPEGNSGKLVNTIAELATLNFFNQFRLAVEKASLPKSFLDCDITNQNKTVFDLLQNLIELDVVGLFTDLIKNLFSKKHDSDSLSLKADNEKRNLFYRKGKFYLANIGIPVFFVESDVNTYFRKAENDKEKDFHEPTNGVIPDDWLQPHNVPYLHDNKYLYNSTYSIQNNLVPSCTYTDIEYDCQIDEPNRIIYSDINDIETDNDEWLMFRTNNYYDFSKSNGLLKSVNGIYNDQVLVSFELTSKLFNARYTLQANTPLDIEIGNGGLFANKPVDIGLSVVGYGGTQNQAFLNTKYGSFWVDAKRGQIFQYTNQVKEITAQNQEWFKKNLPFNILKYFPNVDIDNSYNGIGISLGWDEKYQRLFITKLDYIPVKGLDIFYQDGEFFLREQGGIAKVKLTQPQYFENKSFTMSWSPDIDNFISFHSFLPNYYNSFPEYFQTGIPGSVWTHGLTNLVYNTYYNKLHSYILEYPLVTIPQQTFLKSVSVYHEVLRYYDENNYVSYNTNNEKHYNYSFDKCIIYNQEQTTGLLNLIEQPMGNLRLKMQYPKYNTNSTDILYSKRENLITFNTIYDLTRAYDNNQPMFTNDWSVISSSYPIDKALNPKYVSTANTSYKKLPIKSYMCKIRFIVDSKNLFNFVNHFEINKTEINN